MIILNENFKLYPIEKSGSVKTPEELKGIKSIPATVPGNVELDLIEAGFLPQDIFKGSNILLAEKYETYDWWYETSFLTPKHERAMILRFEGVDCIAKYWLNGQIIGVSSNSMVEHEFDVTDFLKPEGEENVLYVEIHSAVVEANHLDYDMYNMHSTWAINPHGVKLRKPPHCWGWDIMPRAVSAGIWRNIYLYERDIIAIKQLMYHTMEITRHDAKLWISWELDIPDELLNREIFVNIKGSCGDSEFNINEKVYFKLGRGECLIENPKLWWPAGYGEPNVYDTEVSVCLDGEVVAKKTINVGIRTVKLESTCTTNGKNGKFCFIINDTEIMCHGTNWVCLDAYHSRDAKRYDKALEMIKDVGCNIVRCWGGNVYEEECFYDFCDRNGIMIWQDFSMACAPYSQDEEFCKTLEQEAVKVVRRLRVHPSIVLWAGDNECDIMINFLGENPDENKLTREILPKVIFSNDIARPYIPSSPFCGNGKVAPGEQHSEAHLWGPRDYYKSLFYVGSLAHFVSEIGYHGCPCPESMEKILDSDHLWPYQDNEQWNLHSSDQRNSPHRVKLVEEQINQLFETVPDNFEDYCLASQISQAEAKKFFIERIRCNKPNKTGVMWWNLLDGWPQISDAVVDYFFEKKLAYYYIKRSQESFALMMDEMDCWHYTIVAVNDTLKEKNGTYRAYNIDTNETLAEGSFDIAQNGCEKVGKIRMMYSDKMFIVIEWNVDGKKYYNHYLAGMPAFNLEQYKDWLGKFNAITGDK